MNIAGRISGLMRVRPGQSGISASAENAKTGLLQQLGNIRAISPLFIRKNGSGIEIGVVESASSNAVAYPCRVVNPLLNNEVMTPTQILALQEPQRVTYRVKADPNASGKLPVGLDFNIAMPVTYGRPFGTTVKINVAKPGDLCLVSSREGVAELWIISETLGSKLCTPTAPTPPADPVPQFSGAKAATIGSLESTSVASPYDEPMATHSTSATVILDANAKDATTDAFYVGDADYVTLAASVQDTPAVKAGWGRTLNLEWSPDGRTWVQAEMQVPITKAYGLAGMSADGIVALDVRGGIGYVRATWMPGGAVMGAGILLELKWSKKRGTAR